MLESAILDVAIAIYAIVFAVLAVRALLDWRKRRDTSSLWFSAAFLCLAVVVGAGLVAQWIVDGEPPMWFRRITIAILAGYPPCIIWFASSFGDIRRAERTLALAWFGVLAVWGATILRLPAPDDAGSAAFKVFSAMFVLGWLAVSLRVITSLWRKGRTRPGIVRGRMRMLAIGFGFLDLALVLQTLDPEAHLRLLIAALSATSAIVTMLGFAPPLWLRILMRQPEQQRLRNAVAGIASATTETEVLASLLPAARAMLGVHEIALVPFGDPDRQDVVSSGYDEDQLDDIRDMVSRLELAGDTTSTRVDGRLVTRGAASWFVLDHPRGGAFFGADELDVLASIDSVVRLSLTRIRDAQAIVEHEQQLQTAVDIAELGKWNWDVDSSDVWWSPRMYEIFGLEGGEPITYERYQALLAPEERARLRAVIEHSIATGEPYEIDHRIIRPDGSEAWLHSRAKVQRDDHGTARRVTGITMDVSDRIRTEQELRDEIELEREIARRLRAVDELKSNILSAVSHELRTPLTAVHGFAIVLQDRMEEFSAAKRREIVDHLVDQAERLAKLFADLLDIDRLRRGVVEAQRLDVDVPELVLGIVNERERRDRIVVDLAPGTFPLDAPKVERILENLVVNAEKYAGFEPLIRVTTSFDDDGLALVVEDDGPGVPGHLREAIFEPFNRGDAELGYAPGTGIGLSLVQQFSQLHGGTAWVEASATGGARFVVRIPHSNAGSGSSVAVAG